MKSIGFLSFGHWNPSPHSGTRSASDALLQSIDLAVAAEEVGADGAYFRVHHFARQLGSPFPLLAACGARTKRIEIGTAVIDMRYENPLYMMEDAGAADLIAGGRLQLGISRGSPEQVIDGFKHFGYVPAEGQTDADMARGEPVVHCHATFVRADGSETEVGFSIAFARDPASPDVAFFTCKQKAPENFWSPELQRHPNGVEAIAAVMFVAENPTDHHVFLEAFSGSRDVRATSLGLRVATPRGVILAFDRRGFEDSLGLPPPQDAGLRLAALVFRVGDSAATQAVLDKNDIAYREHHERLVIGPEIARGAALVFER